MAIPDSDNFELCWRKIDVSTLSEQKIRTFISVITTEQATGSNLINLFDVEWFRRIIVFKFPCYL